MLNADRVLEWAREMGYPGVGNPEFQESVRRSIIPQTREIWRHLTNCVRPANEVSATKKQLLCYKISVEGNTTHEQLEKFDSVTEYESFLKKKSLETKIDNLNQQIEQKKKQIEVTCARRLREAEEQKRTDSALEKEKIEKLRMLRLKNRKLRDEVQHFRELHSLTEDFVKPSYLHPHQDVELSQLISSLEPGRQVEQLCSHLSSTIRTLNEFIKSERRSSLSSLKSEKMLLHRAIEEHFSQMQAKVTELRNKRNKLEEELENKKREFADPANLDLAQRLKAIFIQEGRLEALIASKEQGFLKSWIDANDVPIVDGPSICFDSIVNIEHSLSQSLSDLKYYSAFPASQLSSSLAEYVKKTRVEASKCPEGDFAVEVDKISSGLLLLVDKFLKTPNIMSKRAGSVSVPNPVGDYQNLKSAQAQKTLADNFPELQLTLRHNFPEPMALLYSLDSSVARQKNRVSELFEEIRALSRQLDDLFKSTMSQFNQPPKYALHELLPDESEFQNSIEKLRLFLSSLSPEEQSEFFQKFSSL